MECDPISAQWADAAPIIEKAQAMRKTVCPDAKMKALIVEITRVVDHSVCPRLVECFLVDAHGRVHRFVEKEAIVSSTSVADGALPAPGVIACEVESEWIDSGGRSLVRATTTRPWGVESITGGSSFVVLAAQLLEI